jgi:hypothetical protein
MKKIIVSFFTSISILILFNFTTLKATNQSQNFEEILKSLWQKTQVVHGADWKKSELEFLLQKMTMGKQIYTCYFLSNTKIIDNEENLWKFLCFLIEFINFSKREEIESLLELKFDNPAGQIQTFKTYLTELEKEIDSGKYQSKITKLLMAKFFRKLENIHLRRSTLMKKFLSTLPNDISKVFKDKLGVNFQYIAEQKPTKRKDFFLAVFREAAKTDDDFKQLVTSLYDSVKIKGHKNVSQDKTHKELIIKIIVKDLQRHFKS